MIDFHVRLWSGYVARDTEEAHPRTGLLRRPQGASTMPDDGDHITTPVRFVEAVL